MLYRQDLGPRLRSGWLSRAVAPMGVAVALLASCPITDARGGSELAAVLTDPGRYDNQQVVVDGVAGVSQWLYVPLPGGFTPTPWAWRPAFVLTDDGAAVWVIVLDRPAPPSPGNRVRVHGVFRASRRVIEATFFVWH